ncbi:MAG: glycoside hydrolase family 1 protein [Chloroflexi bacterium]|nr:glycoside hydrolase family 1 protein [Chloroflexota bacterium]
MAEGDLVFPDGFYWGCAASSHQVEGNCTNNQWWAWEQEGGHIKDGSVSGLACDHYNRFEEDFALARELGQNAHRMSIEWSRVEPEEGRWDQAEVDHYKRVLESMQGNGLTPFVTLHHFTNPLWFEAKGGWSSPDAPELIARYSGHMAKELGDLAPFWLTINEPNVVAGACYVAGVHPPQKRDMALGAQAYRNLLVAHGRMYHAVKESAPHDPKVGIVLNMSFVQPADPDSEEDRQSAELYDRFWNEYFLAGVEKGVISPPVGGGEEAPGLKGTWDVIGLNYYSRTVIRRGSPPVGVEAVPPSEDAERSVMGWEVYPEGLYYCLLRLKRYGIPVYVTENGISTEDDQQRCRYILRHLREVHRAIGDGVDVRSYLHWSLVDNFEWAEGYGQWFGLVAMEPGTLDRKPRASAYMFRDIARTNRVPADLLRHYGL